MTAFIEQGHWYRHIRRMRNTYRRKHQTLIELIYTHFGNQADITGHSAGLHIQITIKTRLNSKALLKLAADKGVRIYDFQEMWMHPTKTNFPTIYLGFGGISEVDMEKGILLLKEAWAGIFNE
jgi:GntR family transcriptional regulator/MocR family aminotransferase